MSDIDALKAELKKLSAKATNAKMNLRGSAGQLDDDHAGRPGDL